MRETISRTHRCIHEGVSNSRNRKSTRLNSSHTVISYAVFCLKKKKNKIKKTNKKTKIKQKKTKKEEKIK